MSTNWMKDITKMHLHYGMNKKFKEMDEQTRQELLLFRAKFLEEELGELFDNLDNPEEVVDALIDLCVVAIGTLDAFGVDGQKAWDEVLRANMVKKAGVKEGRPNPLGLPDLMKPEGWVGPDHTGNHGTLVEAEMTND